MFTYCTSRQESTPCETLHHAFSSSKSLRTFAAPCRLHVKDHGQCKLFIWILSPLVQIVTQHIILQRRFSVSVSRRAPMQTSKPSKNMDPHHEHVVDRCHAQGSHRSAAKGVMQICERTSIECKPFVKRLVRIPTPVHHRCD